MTASANDILLRSEKPGDVTAIHDLTKCAFAEAAHRSGTEHLIVDELRRLGELSLSLVAIWEGRILGHIAFSSVRIDHAEGDWFGLGPVSVAPDDQGCGIGTMLIEAGLAQMAEKRASGCVLLGDPDFYGRFGFSGDGRITYGELGAPYMQWKTFRAPPPRGEVQYSPAFSVPPK